jgi:hypothetical protein
LSSFDEDISDQEQIDQGLEAFDRDALDNYSQSLDFSDEEGGGEGGDGGAAAA